MLQAGWIPVDKGTFESSESGFSFVSDGQLIDGPISSILARKFEKGI
jgi:hypothetical protein